MRLVEWNCRMAIQRKLWLLRELNADLAVVPECASDFIGSCDNSISFLWKGHNPQKGLGVLAFNGWNVAQNDNLGSLPWVLPFKASHPRGLSFDVLAVWTVQNKKVSNLSYAKQVTQMIELYSETMKSGAVAIVGDFNTSIQGPSKVPHKENLSRLESLGLFSAYHKLNLLEHGEEKQMTLKWIGPGRKEKRYCCDFIFLTEKLLKGATAGIHDLWLGEYAKLSDHQPVIADIPDYNLS